MNSMNIPFYLMIKLESEKHSQFNVDAQNVIDGSIDFMKVVFNLQKNTD
jgi:hypothetical protein